MKWLEELFKDYTPVVLYAIAAVTGMIGGCSAASHQLVRGKNLRAAVVFAYGVIGFFLGLLFLAHANYLNVHIDLDRLIASCLIGGFVGSLVLASSNLTARWVLRRLGLTVELNIKHDSTEARDD